MLSTSLENIDRSEKGIKVRLNNQSSTKQKSPESRNRRAITRTIQNLVLWIVISGVLSAIFFTIEKITGTGSDYSWRRGVSTGGWAAGLSIFVTIIGFNLATADILRHYIRQHGRNVISWTTAIIVFTPILAGIVYLLTWPKNQKLTGLD